MSQIDDHPPKSPVTYYGGKQNLAKKFAPLIPKHTIYVEPFAGGAAVLFHKPHPGIATYQEVINDHDQRIINFFKQMQHNPDELLHKLQCTMYAEHEHRTACNMLREPEGYSDLDMAWAYYVVISMSFSGVLFGGWSRVIHGSNPALKWRRKVRTLPEYVERMSEINIASADALDIIDRWDAPHTCFYIDPPYPHANQGHYSGYSMDDFKALWEKLKNIQGSFLLSNYDQGLEVPEDWEVFTFDVQMTAAKRGNKVDQEMEDSRSRTEYLWRKVSKKPWAPDVDKIRHNGKLDCFVGGEEQDTRPKRHSHSIWEMF